MHEHVLAGCRPVPLAHYLKALAVLRLVGEQSDPTARGAWRRDQFVLTTRLSREELERFFLEDYRPTPIVAPWNGGSGFYPKDSTDAITAIEKGEAARFEGYRRAIGQARAVLATMGITDKVDKAEKLELLERCRGAFRDDALLWLDAAYLLTTDGAKYPPLLGTGGNDGRLEFTNNLMQRLGELFDLHTGEARSHAGGHLVEALFATPSPGLVSAAIGQFLPGGAGGCNATAGFDGKALFNGWDFVLMLEGAVLFASATGRRMEAATGGALSYPFTVRQSGAGYGSADASDEASSRAEMWLPLWPQPTGHREISALLAEGRVRVGRRPASNGLDFARAVATLGVDRGIAAFERYGFQTRNGLSYFATPLGRFEVRSRPQVELLAEVDGWLNRFRGRASGDRAPAAVRRALRNLEGTLFAFCRHPDPSRVQEALVAFGRCQQALALRLKWSTDPLRPIAPIPALSPSWLREADDGSAELRLAASIASLLTVEDDGSRFPLRGYFDPVSLSRTSGGATRVRWLSEPGRDVVPPGDLVASLLAVGARRLIRCPDTYRDHPRRTASLGDIAQFIAGDVDDARLLDLIGACLLIDWTRGEGDELGRGGVGWRPGALYAALKLCLAGRAVTDVEVPVESRVFRLAAAGRGGDAARTALRRLSASGLTPALRAIHTSPIASRRAAAALLFPISSRAVDKLVVRVLRPRSLTVERPLPKEHQHEV